jgi:adenine deaminase
MPKRSEGEPLNKYIAKFVSNKHEKREFPNIRQRLAVGYAESKRGKKG